ncbi:MAG: VCBS repeat-containing protein [Planctomycetes bacterium]|nr:VCBS repeat-containing protein [Planctomycetota bacterium]
MNVERALPYYHDNSQTSLARFSDMDGDGHLDLVLQGKFYSQSLVRILFNDGTGRFPVGSDEAAESNVYVTDVNKDGKQDLLVAGSSATTCRILLGSHRRSGYKLLFDRVPAANWSPSSFPVVDMVAGDFDRDGRVDIATVEGVPPRAKVYMQFANGQWRDESTMRFPQLAGYERAITVDLDSDGDLDVIYYRFDGLAQPRAWLNDGSGRFADRTSAVFPSSSTHTRAIALADLNGDKRLDVVLANKGAASLWLQNAFGSFQDASNRLPTHSIDATGIAVGDIDQDGSFDILISANDSSQAWKNDGGANFTNITSSFRIPSGTAVGLGDVDQNGLPDVAVAGRQDRVFWNMWPSNLHELPNPDPDRYRLNLHPSDVVKLDDRMPPTLAEGGSSNGLRVRAIRGFGRYDPSRLLLYPGDSRRWLDIDADGDLDVIDNDVNVFVNEGTRFGSYYFPKPRGRPVMAAADFDGDRDVDFFIAHPGVRDLQLTAGSSYFVRKEAAAFSWTKVPQSALTADPAFSAEIVSGDYDGDGDIDVVVANEWLPATASPPPSRLWLNDGKASFQRAHAFPQVYASGVATGDLDGDGRLDLLFASWPARLFFGESAARFREVTQSNLGVTVNAVGQATLIDLDEDRDLDAVLLVSANNALHFQVLENDGRGVMRPAWHSESFSPPIFVGTTPFGLIDIGYEVVDIDEDGDLDIFMNPQIAFENTTRAFDATVPKRGSTWVAQVHASRRASSGFTSLAISPRQSTRIVLDGVGVLRLDPASILLTPLETLARPGTRVEVPIPSAFPGGIEMNVQAAYFDLRRSSNQVRLGALWSDRIR